MIKNIKEIIYKHVMNNSVKYFFLILCYVVGITAGAIFVNSLPGEESDELMSVISSFCTGISDGEFRAGETFYQSMLNNLRTAVLLYICGMSIYLVPLVYLHMTAKGFVVGFTIGFMTIFFGGKGFLFVFVSILPQNIILLPVIMALSVLSHNHAAGKRRTSKNYFLKDEGKRRMLKYTYSSVAGCMFMAVSAVIDAFVIPIFAKAIGALF